MPFTVQQNKCPEKNSAKTTKSFFSPQRQITSLSLLPSVHCNPTQREGSDSIYIAFSFCVLLSELNTSLVAVLKYCKAGTMCLA